MWRRPILQIINEGGKNIMPALDGYWTSCEVTHNAAEKSDEAEIECIGPPSKMGLPTKGTKFTILMGWADQGPVKQGVFKVQKLSLKGEPGSGETITITLRAADLTDKLKASGKAHYDEGTLGDLWKKIAGEVGLEPALDKELAAVKVPYQLRWDQSPIDFLSEIGTRYGADVKPAGGKLVGTKRGSGKSASGKFLAPINIHKRRAYGYEIETEPRPEAGSVAASYHDEKTGKRKVVKEKTGRAGPIYSLSHPFRNEDEAKAAAKAEAFLRGDNSGTGHFDSPGLPKARPNASVIATGFGWPIDGKWKAETIKHKIDVSGGFKTTVNVKAGDEDKGKKKKDKE